MSQPDNPVPQHAASPADTAGTPRARPAFAAVTLGLIGALVVLLAGGWLMLAPFALGYQPDGAGWVDATHADFWTGLGIAVIALLAGLLLVADLRGRLRAAGLVAARKATPEAAPVLAAPPAAAAPGDELVALLRPLVAALGRDNDGAARPAERSNSTPTNAGPSNSLEH
jgi:hypothetical protein